MGKPKFYSDWLIADDEFHPDVGVAASHADQSARKAARDYLKRQIARYESMPSRDMLDEASLSLLRVNLAAVEQDIKDNEPTTDPED